MKELARTNSSFAVKKSNSNSPFNQMPCTALKGVGPRVAERLQKLNLNTVQDLLFHLPFRYQDRTRITPLGSLRVGDYAVIEAAIELAELSKSRRRSLLCRLHDGTGFLTLRFFYFNAAQQRDLSRGMRVRCFGEVRWGTLGFEMIHPEYRILHENESPPIESHLTPIYPTTEGLHQLTFRKLTDQALILLKNHRDALNDYLVDCIDEYFPQANLSDALHYLHRPPLDASCELLETGIHPAQQRLAFEELLAHQLSLGRLRSQIKQQNAPCLSGTHLLTEKFLKQLTFTLTAAQQRVISEIEADLAQTKPMLRLVQGDVGSGKTVVAALTALRAIEMGYQVAMVAPTEILAEQHFQNFQRWFAALGLTVTWLSGKLKTQAKRDALTAIANGTTHLAIGTHALFQDAVQFSRLALLIVDEQHRFGVQQRLALREKGLRSGHYPHQLIMTATPIPRTLSMVAYADLDCSVIDELPPGRSPVQTAIVSNQRRAEVVARVQQNCREGKQAYWICTLIEESESLQCQAAEVTATQLSAALPELRIGLIHGRLNPGEKEQIMLQFKTKMIDLLVATTVIEVGVDVPNASLMVIENAERLGLSQLHQLRGRVGRGSIQSHCVLLYQTPLSLFAKQRLATMRETNDGFVIAQRDLELRGPGEILGTRQTGLLQFKVANLLRDKALLINVQKVSNQILAHYHDRIEFIIQRWLGSNEHYGNV